MKKFNINNFVLVRLTDKGKEILTKYYQPVLDSLKDAAEKEKMTKYIYKRTIDGLYELQLWKLMNIFGSYMFNGNNNPPFEVSEILIDDKDLK